MPDIDREHDGHSISSENFEILFWQFPKTSLPISTQTSFAFELSGGSSKNKYPKNSSLGKNP